MMGPTLSDSLEDVDEFVFGASVLVLTALVSVIALFPSTTSTVLDRIVSLLYIQDGLGHQSVILLAIGFIFAVFFSPASGRKLGGADVRPEFGSVTYFALLFSAAIAAGIVFWGPVEAIIHYSEVPPGVDAQPQTPEAATAALQYSLFHWGVSVWSIYLVFGVIISYFVYTHGAPLRVSAVLTPFLGVDRLDSYPAKIVDILGIVAPIVGTTATVAQVSQLFIRGIEHHWTTNLGDFGVLIFMLAMAFVFTTSAITGVYRGIKRLSYVNMGGFVVLGGIVTVLGPTFYILEASGNAVGRYVIEFGAMSTATGTGWLENWTLFYWAWWLSWGPYVGLFVARISRGRTLRSVILYGVGATSLATTAWFLLLGGTAIRFEQIDRTVIPRDQALAGFRLFETFPGGTVMIFLFLALIITFLVTSADSLTLSVAFLTTEPGTAPSRELRAVWGGIQAAMITALLLAGGTELATSVVVVMGTLVAPVLVVAVFGMGLEFDPLEQTYSWFKRRR